MRAFTPRGILVARLTGACVFGGLVSACSSGPLASLTSLSPAIQGNTLDDNNVVADASDQIILMNVLRAKDREPLDMGALTSLGGTLSFSGSAGFSIPFGSKPKDPTGNTSTPSISGSTSPTYTFTPLNNQGFTTAVLQPVSAAYVQNRWDAGISRKLLLLLFVKNISFPLKSSFIDEETQKPVEYTHYVTFSNNPDDPIQLRAFRSLVDLLVQQNAELKSFDLLDPVGPPFNFISGKVNGTDAEGQPNQTSFGFVTSASDGQYHVGNAANEDGDLVEGMGQLYRVYAGQVALCVNGTGLKSAGLNMPQPPVTKKPKAVAGQAASTEYFSQLAGVAMNSQLALALSLKAPGGSGTGTTATPKSPASPGPSGGATTAGTTAALQAGRYSSVVDQRGCGFSQIVLPQRSETNFQNSSTGFVHIEWRSVSEIFEYLGAVLRYEDRNDPIVWYEDRNSCTATEDAKAEHPDDFAKAEAASKGAVSKCSSYIANIDAVSTTETLAAAETLFRLPPRGYGHLEVEYRNREYGISDDETDQSKTVLSMLGTLVNLANGSTSVSSQPLQLLPIP